MLRTLFFSLAAFFASIIPFVFAFKYTGVYADHWMYLPSIWILFFASGALTGFYVRSSLTKKIFILILVLSGSFLYAKTCIMQVNSFSKTQILSNSVLTQSPDAIALGFRSIDLRKKGMSEEASRQMDKAVRFRPSSPKIRYLRGRLLLSLDEIEKAEKDFLKAIELDPGYANGYVGMALCHLSQGDSRSGIRDLEKALEFSPAHPEALMLLSMAYFDSGDPLKARETALRAIKADPFGYDALVNMGTILSRQGNIAEAGKYYFKATEFYPEEPVSFYNIAYLLYISGDLENARFYASKTVLIDPGYTPAKDLLRKIREDRASLVNNISE